MLIHLLFHVCSGVLRYGIHFFLHHVCWVLKYINSLLIPSWESLPVISSDCVSAEIIAPFENFYSVFCKKNYHVLNLVNKLFIFCPNSSGHIPGQAVDQNRSYNYVRLLHNVHHCIEKQSTSEVEVHFPILSPADCFPLLHQNSLSRLFITQTEPVEGANQKPNVFTSPKSSALLMQNKDKVSSQRGWARGQDTTGKEVQ